MNRRSVIRSILGLAVAPKILAEIDFKPVVQVFTPAYSFKELHFVVPEWLPRLIEKYGNSDFTTIMQAAKDEDFPTLTPFTQYEKRMLKKDK